MAPFERKYTPAQWQAIYDAKFARGVGYARIAELAASGELTGEPFEITARYTGEKCRDERKKRLGKTNSNLADKPHRDAVEVLRRRMISAADALSRHYHDLAVKTPEKADPERGRQIARLLREAAALPAMKTDTTAKPGERVDGHRTEGPTRNGVAGGLLRAHLASDNPQDNTSDSDQATRRADETEAASQDDATRSGSPTRSNATRSNATRSNATPLAA